MFLLNWAFRLRSFSRKGLQMKTVVFFFFLTNHTSAVDNRLTSFVRI